MAKGENKRSEVGRVKTKLGAQTVHEIEHYKHAGSPGGRGVSFKLPKDVSDHSCLKTPEHK